jgi:selenocysteine lyase/cysteine desulfurase/tRNA(Ile)-lysidine synthase TilS/MesJ
MAFRSFMSDETAVYSCGTREERGAVDQHCLAELPSMVRYVRDSIVGDYDAIPTPLGPRKLTYVDHTASGRAVEFIERYISENVLPLYANTHTSTSECGWQSHMFLAEARDIVRDTVGASERDDVVLFTGRGATAGSNMLAHYVLGFTCGRPSPLQKPHACSFPGCGRAFACSVDLHMHARTHPDGEQSAWQKAPLAGVTRDGNSCKSEDELETPQAPQCRVIVGPFAHHSSILPWRERNAAISMINADLHGCIDFEQLYERLEYECAVASRAGAPLLCVFTAASNVTGATVDVDAITALCKFFGCLCFWDFAAAAPHCSIDMSSNRTFSWLELAAHLGVNRPAPATFVGTNVSCSRDAVYFSSHKFVGGPSTPGVLVMKRKLFASSVPHLPGGGTVFFVHEDGTPRYLSNDAEREEGGSPDLVASVRCGLAMNLFRNVGLHDINCREHAMAVVARDRWARHPLLRVLPTSVGSVPIVAFNILTPMFTREELSAGSDDLDAFRPAATAKLLHWGFVCAVLNDFFGIQSRGGCLCAGPYSMQLLGIDSATAIALERQLLLKDELLRPGVVRISFAYYMSHPAFQFVLEAVEWVAWHGFRILHLYTPVADTGEWKVNRSLAAAHLTDGYKFIEKCARGDHSLTSAASSAIPNLISWTQSLQQTTPGTSTTPAQFIAALTHGDGAGHLQQAQRGGTRTHPRRWLQDMHFDGAKASWPNFRVQVKFQPEESAGSAVVQEYRLYSSYLQEGDVVIAGMLSRQIPKAPHHHPKSLLSMDGLTLRWFATAWDFENSTEALPAISWIPNAMACHAVSAHLEDVSPFISLAACPRLSFEQMVAWDGGNGGTTAMAAESPVAPSTLEHTVRKPQRAFKQARSKLIRDATGVQPAETVEVLHVAVTHEATTTNEVGGISSHAHKRGSNKSTMSEEAYREKAKRFARVKASLSKLPSPPRTLLEHMKRAVIRGLQDFSMIKDGDRLLVGVSGGKDSLSLLILLLMLQERSPVRYEVAACTVDPMYAGFDPSPLKVFLKEMGVPYYYASEPVIDLAATHMDNDSICAWCSRMKRGILYTTARRYKYNVLVLGQHMDDFAESFVMSAFRNGVLRTMKAHYINDVGDVRIIRPLVYVRERHTREFATVMHLPIINENCPACFTGPTERYHVKKLLATEESTNPILFNSLSSAMRILMTDEGAHVVRNMEIMADDADAKRKLLAKTGVPPGIGAVLADFMGAGHAALDNPTALGKDLDDDTQGPTAQPIRFPTTTAAYIVNLTMEDEEKKLDPITPGASSGVAPEEAANTLPIRLFED